jgi:phospholipid/cholesterol/gamma-HCH transport system substrate-binding protein
MESANWKREALLGGVVVAGIAALVWSTFSFGSRAPLGSVPYTFLFDSALGLSVDNSVAIAGVKVGVVDNIAVEGKKARVTVRVAPEIALFSDAKGAVRQRTLLGEKYLDLDPGNDNGAPLAAGASIANNLPTVEIDQLVRDISTLVDRLNRIVPPLEGALDSMDQAVKTGEVGPFAYELVAGLQDVRALVREIHKVVGSSGDDLHAVLALAREKGPGLVEHLEGAASKADSILGAIDPRSIRTLSEQAGPAATTAARNVELASTEMRAAMTDMRQAAQRIDGVLSRLDGALKRLDGIDESYVREFLQIQGVRVNLIPDSSLSALIKKIRENNEKEQQ